MSKYIWVIIVSTPEGDVVNRIFTEEDDAKRYAKDYSENAPFLAKAVTRKLNNRYIDSENRHCDWKLEEEK